MVELTSRQTTSNPYLTIPNDLKECPQWVMWRKVPRNNGKIGKIPYNPHTGTEANPADRQTWITYTEAIAALEQGTYDGIGFVFSGNDPFVGIDLDGCIVDGKMDQWAQEIIDQIDGYTEISPSGTGVKIFVQANILLSRGNRKDGRIEIYNTQRFFTVTGQRTSHTTRIENRQAEVEDWYHITFPLFISHRISAPDPSEVLEDEQILALLKRAKNKEKFKQLWDGDTKGYPSHSEADLALFSYIAFYTQNIEQIERIVRHSGLRRAKWDEHPTYLLDSIEKAVDNLDETYKPPKTREDKREEHTYPWQQLQEDRDLSKATKEIKDVVSTHLTETNESVLVVMVPPGAGKSTTIADWGKDQDIAYIVERHDQYEQVRGLHKYRHILGCSSANCPESEVARRGSALGFNMWPFHRRHYCQYYQQFNETGSAVYQIAHVQTSHPGTHKAVVVDELNLSSWVIEHILTAGMIQSASDRAMHHTVRKGERVLRGLIAILRETKMPLTGKILLDTLNEKANGQLEEGVQELAAAPWLMEERPVVDIKFIEEMGHIVIPMIVNTIQQELPQWKTGQNWNSRIYIGQHNDEYALLIQEPRRFQGNIPLSILDATAHPELFSKLFGRPIEVKTIEIDPPPNMKHIAVRTGKRYGKGMLTGEKNSAEDLQRVIKELHYILREIDPDKQKSIGLITYAACQDTIGKALNIPEERRGHFWAIRGSNAFEDCEILLVVGTPTPNLDSITHWAQMLYANDTEPIDTMKGLDGKYQDERLRGLVDYLIEFRIDTGRA